MKVRSGGRQNKRAGGWIEDAMGEFLLQSGLRRALRSRHEQAPRSEDEEE
jgi:hypothetical protein